MSADCRQPLIHPLAAAVALVLSGSVQAATLTVDSTADNTTVDGNCTLREAINAINTGAATADCPNTGAAFGSNDTILFDAGLANATITLNGNDIDITPALTITGPIAGDASSITIDANNNSRIFNVRRNILLTLENLTLTNGSVADDGGAVNSDGSLILNSCLVSANSTSGDGSDGGGLFAKGNITLTQSMVSGNSTGGNRSEGGGLLAQGNIILTQSTASGNSTGGNESEGGGLFARGDITLTQSTISGNFTLGTESDGGGLAARGNIALNQSTVSGNATRGNESEGGGLFARGDLITLIQSTVSGNATRGINSTGGGLFTRGGNVDLIQSTLTNNSTSAGSGGLEIDDGSGNAVIVTLQNSIAAANIGPVGNFNPQVDDGGSVTLNASYSLFGDVGEINVDNGGNIISDNPDLGPLQNNGGPTETHLPNITSPALDTGNNADAPDTVDQRDTGFPRIINDVVDIGSVEHPTGRAGLPLAAPVDIPTLSQWGRWLLISVLGAGLLLNLRRSRRMD